VITGFVWVVPMKVIRWKDGDTCEGFVDKGWRDFTDREGVRIQNLWCAELNEPGGLEAKQHAEFIAPAGTVVVLHSKALGKLAQWASGQMSLERTVADIRLIDGSDFASLMIAGGYGFRTEAELKAWLNARLGT
jgi:hypothetical protein